MQKRAEREIERRALLSSAVSGSLLAVGAATGAMALQGPAFPRDEGQGAIASGEKETARFRISLNTSTLRGHKLPLIQVIEIAAKAGYGGIEPWPDEMDRHLESGGSLKDLDKQLKDHGLKVTGAIAFFEWMVDDEKKRAQ